MFDETFLSPLESARVQELFQAKNYQIGRLHQREHTDPHLVFVDVAGVDADLVYIAGKLEHVVIHIGNMGLNPIRITGKSLETLLKFVKEIPLGMPDNTNTTVTGRFTITNETFNKFRNGKLHGETSVEIQVRTFLAKFIFSTVVSTFDVTHSVESDLDEEFELVFVARMPKDNINRNSVLSSVRHQMQAVGFRTTANTDAVVLTGDQARRQIQRIKELSEVMLSRRDGSYFDIGSITIVRNRNWSDVEPVVITPDPAIFVQIQSVEPWVLANGKVLANVFFKVTIYGAITFGGFDQVYDYNYLVKNGIRVGNVYKVLGADIDEDLSLTDPASVELIEEADMLNAIEEPSQCSECNTDLSGGDGIALQCDHPHTCNSRSPVLLSRLLNAVKKPGTLIGHEISSVWMQFDDCFLNYLFNRGAYEQSRTEPSLTGDPRAVEKIYEVFDLVSKEFREQRGLALLLYLYFIDVDITYEQAQRIAENAINTRNTGMDSTELLREVILDLYQIDVLSEETYSRLYYNLDKGVLNDDPATRILGELFYEINERHMKEADHDLEIVFEAERKVPHVKNDDRKLIVLTSGKVTKSKVKDLVPKGQKFEIIAGSNEDIRTGVITPDIVVVGAGTDEETSEVLYNAAQTLGIPFTSV